MKHTICPSCGGLSGGAACAHQSRFSAKELLKGMPTDKSIKNGPQLRSVLFMIDPIR
nr:hypothetical protein [uncultured Stomatobaculum sp.]